MEGEDAMRVAGYVLAAAVILSAGSRGSRGPDEPEVDAALYI